MNAENDLIKKRSQLFVIAEKKLVYFIVTANF